MGRIYEVMMKHWGDFYDAKYEEIFKIYSKKIKFDVKIQKCVNFKQF